MCNNCGIQGHISPVCRRYKNPSLTPPSLKSLRQGCSLSNGPGTPLVKPYPKNSNISIGAISSLNSNVIIIKIQDTSFKALVDTGASISCISMSLLSKLPSPPKLLTSNINQVRGFGGEFLSILGCARLKVCIKGCEVLQKFHVFKRIHFSVIL